MPPLRSPRPELGALPVIRLEARLALKPWGRKDLRPWFEGDSLTDPVGEVIFPPARAGGLLAKYLFTSEALSVQVHPDDATARRHGHPGGKEEAWLILAAEPGARIGLGLTDQLSAARLAEAARDGSIEDLLGWRQVAAGDVLRIPPGTIHAIGAGLALVEIQENCDLTYRLYDYGRPRDLHLEQAVEAACAGPYRLDPPVPAKSPGWRRIVQGKAFTVDHWHGQGWGHISSDLPFTLVPLGDTVTLNGMHAAAGTVWEADGAVQVSIPDGASLLIACPTGSAEPELDWQTT